MNTISVEFNQSLFTLSDPSNSFLNNDNKIILKKITGALKKRKKIILLTGEKHSGKTTLIQRAVAELSLTALLITASDKEAVNYEKLIDCIGSQLSDDFSSETSLDKKISYLQDLVKNQAISHIVLLFNQQLKIDPIALEPALKLVDSDLFESCFVHLVITGSNDSKEQLKEGTPPFPTINNTNSFQASFLSENDIRNYIKFHLKHLNEQGQDLFSDAAVKRIILYSKGLPGLINRLCNLGLLTANIEEKSIVTGEIMDEVLENSLFLGNEFDYTPPEPDIPSATSFLPTLNQQDKTLHQSPIEKSEKPVVENNLFNSDLVERIVEQGRKTESVTKPFETQKKIKQEAKNHTTKKNTITLDVSNKSIVISAFVMGMIASGLITAGWFFLEKQESLNTANSKYQVDNELVKEKVAYDSQNNAPSQLIDADGKAELSNIKVESTIQSTGESGHTIDALFQLAEQQIASKKLMTPIEDNAWATYKKILETNPTNQQAKSGIYKIKETYTRWARKEIDRGNTRRAIYFLNNALKISPDDTEVLDTLLIIKNIQSTKKNEYSSKLGSNLYKLLEEPNGISKLLAIADQQIAKKNLTKPAGKSALSIYNLILDRFPKHKQAILGMTKIKNTYLSWAKNEIRLGNFTHAEYLYAKALDVAPSDPEVLSDLDQLKKATGKF